MSTTKFCFRTFIVFHIQDDLQTILAEEFLKVANDTLLYRTLKNLFTRNFKPQFRASCSTEIKQLNATNSDRKFFRKVINNFLP